MVDVPAIAVEDLHVSFGGVRALAGVDLSLKPGELHGLIGPNGAGKTTLFNSISRLNTPSSGSIRAAGVDLLTCRPEDIAEHHIARTFQNVVLYPALSILENVMLGAHCRADTSILHACLSLPGYRRADRRIRADALAMLDSLGVVHLADVEPDGLPLGTRKRVELARALMSQPKVLMLDEPANGLTSSEVEELGRVITNVRNEFGLSVLLVEHHMGLVMNVSDAITVLNFGRTIATGTIDQVRSDPAVIEAYLGTAA